MSTRRADIALIRRALLAAGQADLLPHRDTARAALEALERLERNGHPPTPTLPPSRVAGWTGWCELCNTEKTEDEMQWSGRGHTYFLCKACYATTPAAVWDQTVNALARDDFPGYGAI
jgi:hypothetical protein